MSKGAAVDPDHGPVTKRQKLANGSDDKKPTARIFAPFRTVGLVSSTAVPFTSLPLGKTTFQITTSVGRCLHTYDLRKGLNLVFLTRPQTPAEITATSAWKDRVFAAWGGEGTTSAGAGVWVFKRGKKAGELEIPKGPFEAVKRLTVFGSWIVGCCASRIEVWKSATYEHYTSLTPSSSKHTKGSVLTGDICSLPTFLNKVFVGRRDGSVEIWNLSTGKIIYTILPPKSTSGAVTALEPAPALSLLAIAHVDGSIIIHNVRTDKKILHLNQKASPGSKVGSISFRTDGAGAGDDGTKEGIMATAGPGSGDITLWDLTKGGRVKGVLRGAHNPAALGPTGDDGGINRVEFLPGQDVMITSGMDNALKSWIFDANSLSPTPRILHSRCGHAAPVTRLGFVPSNSDGSDAGGKWLMSAGRDQSLWAWSLRRDGQSTELSQGNLTKKAKKLGLLGKSLEETKPSTTLDDLKAPEIISMACSLNRDGGMGAAPGAGAVWTNSSTKKGSTEATETLTTGWESVVTGHRGDKYARTWFWGRKKAGRWALETGDGTEVTTVGITSCGSFAIVGSAGGSISMFNLQSGMLRQKFPSSLTPAQARRLKMSQVDGSERISKYALGEGKHKKAVTGLMVDSLNRTVISCSLDGTIKFWDFTTGCLQDEIDWSPMTGIISCQYHRPNDLIALSCDDLSIRVVDTETKKLVRELWGCLGHINDFCFSNDGRWIVAASMDSIIRVWDLPTGHLINALRLESPCTALAFSDTGEFLATAHADSLGISMWTNRTLFTHVPTRMLQEHEIAPAIAPTTSGEHGEGLISAAFSDPQDEAPDPDSTPFSNFSTPDQISTSMVTLSLVPKSRWQTLLHLDTIRQRNKPKEPPKPPEKAPFFLPSLNNNNNNNHNPSDPPPAQTPTDQSTTITPFERSHISKLDAAASTKSRNHFSTTLLTASTTKNYHPFLTHLISLAPSAADIEIRSLHPDEMVPFIEALIFRLEERRDFELVQAWMAVFLRVHGDVVVVGGGVKGGLLRVRLAEWRVVQEREGRRLGDLVGFCGGVVAFLRSGR